MRERPRFQERLYRYSLRKLKRSSHDLKRSSHDEDQQLLRLALADRTIFVMAYEQTMEDLAAMQTAGFGFKVNRAADGSPIVDNLLKLLDWFVQNGPALIEVIRLIAGLFGGTAAASAVLRDDFDAQSEELGDQ